MNRSQAEALLWRVTLENQRDRSSGEPAIVLSDAQARQLQPIYHREPGQAVQLAALTDDEVRVLLPDHYREQFQREGEAA